MQITGENELSQVLSLISNALGYKTTNNETCELVAKPSNSNMWKVVISLFLAQFYFPLVQSFVSEVDYYIEKDCLSTQQL